MGECRKYYEAYDDRYRQVHSKGLQWSSSENSEIVERTIKKYGISKTANILEIGCGEGRDANFLLKKGYNLLATDVSPAAVKYCRQCYPEKLQSFQVLNCLTDRTGVKYDFIYAIAVLHMLVLEEDRKLFYRSLSDQLSDNGLALICTIGDGKKEWETDPSRAFELQKRIHGATGRELYLAGTSCRDRKSTRLNSSH